MRFEVCEVNKTLKVKFFKKVIKKLVLTKTPKKSTVSPIQ